MTMAEHLNRKRVASIVEESDKRGTGSMSIGDAEPSTSEESDLVSKRGQTADDELEENARKIRVTSSRTSGVYAASGLKNSMHGNVYQLKYLMLVLYRAWKRKSPFRLATEMDAAEKFDDIVLHYKDKTSNDFHGFVQVKHKQNDNEKISARDLLAADVSNEPFSVVKYFKSWRKIRKHEDFSGSRLKHFILCTNIGFDEEGLKKENIEVRDYPSKKSSGAKLKSEVWESDEFLIVTDGRPLRNLWVAKGSKLHHKLESASDVNSLARELAHRIHKSQVIDRKTSIFKFYAAALAKEVIDIEAGKLFDNFVTNSNDLTESAKKFRAIFFQNMKELQPNKNASDEYYQNSLKNKPLKISTTFCQELASATALGLPNDDIISYEEISKFLTEFILAVNQPNEAELGAIIKRELGADCQFNLQDAELVEDSFQKVMLNWFKEKSGYFLVNEDADGFFRNIQLKLSSVKATGLTLEYVDKLRNYGIEFQHENKGLLKFLRSSDPSSKQKLKFVCTVKTLLPALSIYQTLMYLPEKFKANDSFIFIRLETLLLPNAMDQVLRAFEWPRNHNLLIVDCESMTEERHTHKLWDSLRDILSKNNDKRMILIVQESNDSTHQFEAGYEFLCEEDVEFSIMNMKEHSQQKLLEHKGVEFQGHQQSFGRLLNIRNFEKIGSAKLGHLQRIFDQNTVVRLIKGEKIQIGSEVEGLGTIQNYYIPRRIVRHVVIKENIFKAPGITDLFSVSSVDRQTLEKLLGNEKRLRAFDEYSQTEPHRSICITLANGEEVNQFESLRQRNANRNIHWLDGISGKLIWRQSSGDITYLLKYKDVSGGVDDDKYQPGAVSSNECELVGHDPQRRVVILSDTAGMGKSSILSSLAGKIKDNVSREMKDHEPPLLMIRVNLTQHTNFLARERANRTFNCNSIDRAVDFLVDKLSSIDKSNDLASLVYKTMIKDHGQAVLFFDGFDEISPTYGPIVSDLLRALVKLPIKKIFVTTRPHTSEVLESKLGTFAHRLQPFSPEDQRNFLKKFWKMELSKHGDEEVQKADLEMHAERVISLLARSINSQMTEFTGVPLQTRMVAEIYQYSATMKQQAFRTTVVIEDSEDSQSKLPEKIDIIELYEQFVDKKYNVFFLEKQPGDLTNLAARQSREDGHLMSMMKHQKFALDVLFDEEVVCSLLDSQPGVMYLIEHCRGKKNEDVERAGIVTLDINDKPHFIHRTFAEYFAATFLVDTLRVDNRNQHLRDFFMSEFFVDSEYKTVRAFLDCLLSRKAHAVKTKSWKLDLREHRKTIDHQTVYHKAAKECNVEIVKFFINCLHGHSSNDSKDQETNVDLQDKKGRTPLAIAIDNTRNLELVECFVDGGADVHWKSLNGETLLHIAAMKSDNLAIVEYLCDTGINVNCQDSDGKTPLHRAAYQAGNMNAVTYLCSRGAEINCQDKKGDTPLHSAAYQHGNSNIMKYLCDQGAEINCHGEKGNTPLHHAVYAVGNLDIVEYLCTKGADINCRNEGGETPLHRAADRAGNFDIVKYLCDKGVEINCHDRLGYTPLRRAAYRAENLDMVRYLCDKGASINCDQLQGWTPLHDAGRRAATLDTAKYLCEKGANLNRQDGEGKTPLHWAAFEAGNLETVKYLCDKGADVNCRDHEGQTPLYFAACKAGNLDIVKYLWEKGNDINFQGEEEVWTLLKRAIIEAGDLNIVKYLGEKFASINYRNRNGRTLLHCAAEKTGKLDILKYLCDRGADVNCQDKCGRTPLHYAVDCAEKIDIVKYLCDRGASVNCQDQNLVTPLHHAVFEARDLSLVEYLIAKGSNINAPTNFGVTPLHSAVEAGYWNVFKLLIDQGANTKAKDYRGNTPLSMARYRFGAPEIISNLYDDLDDVDVSDYRASIALQPLRNVRRRPF